MSSPEPMVPVKHLTFLNRSTLPEDTDADYEFAYVDIGSVTTGEMSIPEKTITFSEAPSRARRLARPGDVVISTVRTYLRALAQVPSVDADLVFSTGFAVVHPEKEKVDGRYLAYAMQADPFTEAVEAMSVGISYPAVNASDVGNVKVWAPSMDKQRAIAEFLDRETAQIDAMIDAQERLVALLEERRAAAITRAITLGLDEAAELKDSGVDWLGRVPSHWTVQRLGRLGRSTIGLTYRPEDIVDDPDAGTLVLRASNIQNGRISLEDSVYVSSGIPPALRLRAGDILICARNGSARLVGKNARITRDLEGQTWGAFMTVFRSPINEFVGWVLNSSIFQQQIGLFSTSTINQLTASTLHSFKIALPPEEEQQQIISFLERTTTRIDAMISKSRESIALMKERRAAVISAAVTGRIDVRTGIEQVERDLEEARA